MTVLLWAAVSACQGACTKLDVQQQMEADSPPPLQNPTADDPTLNHWKIKPGSIQSGEMINGQVEPNAQQSALDQPQIYHTPAASEATVGSGPQVVTNDDQKVTLNFVGADVREVVSSILGDTLKANYVIDPRVQGTVTFRTVSPIAKSEVMGVLEDILALTGTAIVPSGNSFKIVPIDQASKAPVLLGSEGSPIHFDHGFGVHFIPVHYASAEAVKSAVDQIVPPGRSLFVDAERHMIMFVGTGTEAQDIADFIATLDVDPMAGKTFGLFPVRFSDPESVAKELQLVFSSEGSPDSSGMVQIVPIDHMSAVLVISDQPDYVERARDWVERLDHGAATTERRLYVYYVQNGRAAELASLLGQVLGISTSASAPPSSPLAPGLGESNLSSGQTSGFSSGSVPGLPGTSTLSMSQPQETALGNGYQQNQGQQGLPAAQQQDQGASAVEGQGGSGAPGSGGQPNQLRIVADSRNNALIIYATPKEYELIDAALQKLDIVPLQVLIEATIAEVTLNHNLQYGLQWFFNSGSNNFTFSTLKTGVVASAFPGFSYLLSAADARVVLNALSAITKVRVISSPELMVLNNESARLQVGDQVPVITQSSVSSIDPNAPIVNQVQYLDTGVILNITPRVNPGGLVLLDISQEVSDVTTTSSSTIDSPTIEQRRIASSVAVNSGETIALGGLIKDTTERDVSGIPLLSNIPWVGNLFKTTTNSNERTELLVLLSPRVIRGSSDARMATDELRQKLKGLAGFNDTTP